MKSSTKIILFVLLSSLGYLAIGVLTFWVVLFDAKFASTTSYVAGIVASAAATGCILIGVKQALNLLRKT